jgi:hypothetical protein
MGEEGLSAGDVDGVLSTISTSLTVPLSFLLLVELLGPRNYAFSNGTSGWTGSTGAVT